MERPTRYYVEVMLACPHSDGDEHECCPHLSEECNTESLRAAKAYRTRRLREGAMNAAVLERPGIREDELAPGVWYWDEDELVVEWR